MGKENKSKYALLGMLSLGPMSGYDLKKMIEYSIGHFWQENYAQIYPMLKQLTSEGLATSHIEEQQGKPDRRVYTLTDRGRDELRHWLAEPADSQVIRSELLLKLFFGSHVPLPKNIEHIRQHRELQIQKLHILQATEAHIRDTATSNPRLPYWLLTLSSGKRHTQAAIDWCDEALATLEKLAETPSLEVTSQQIDCLTSHSRIP